MEGGKVPSMLLKCLMLINAINFAYTNALYLPYFQVTILFCGAQFNVLNPSWTPSQIFSCRRL